MLTTERAEVGGDVSDDDDNKYLGTQRVMTSMMERLGFGDDGSENANGNFHMLQLRGGAARRCGKKTRATTGAEICGSWDPTFSTRTKEKLESFK